jgi:hypothetical protein
VFRGMDDSKVIAAKGSHAGDSDSGLGHAPTRLPRRGNHGLIISTRTDESLS